MQLPVWATITLIRTWCEKPSVCLKANKVKPGFTSLLVFLVGCFLVLHVCWKTWPTCCVCQQWSYRCNSKAFTWRKCQGSPALKGWHMDSKTENAPKTGWCICSYVRKKCQKLYFMGFSSVSEVQGKICCFLWLRCMASLLLLNASVLTYVPVTVKKTSSDTCKILICDPSASHQNASNIYTAEILTCQHSD